MKPFIRSIRSASAALRFIMTGSAFRASAKYPNGATTFQKLGIGSVILNPIFESDNHGYDTRDFRSIDCRLGTNDDFRAVCEDLHSHGIKVMLDGVFNHVGRGFWAFKDVQKKKWDSPYKDWFHLSFEGNSCYDDGFWYEGWEGHFELVKLNLQNPAVTDYLLDCVKFWIDHSTSTDSGSMWRTVWITISCAICVHSAKNKNRDLH